LAPSKERHGSDLLARRRRRARFLSSHWTGLQSAARVPGTTWVGAPTLRLDSPACPKDSQLLCAPWSVARELRGAWFDTLAALMPLVLRPEYLRTRLPVHADTSSSCASWEGRVFWRVASTGGPSMGFCGSTTLSDRDSDLHRACLTRLCCASRLSQPLDALIPPLPFRPCFMPVTPLSFCLQRVPPSDSRAASRHRLPLLSSRTFQLERARTGHADFRDLSTRKVRSPRAVLPVDRGPCLS
jgi:hypothetical protein